MFTDTIVARSTAEANGAVGMIRLSGKDALSIATQVIHKKNTSKNSKSIQPRRVYLGNLHDEEERLIDEVVYIYYDAPRSYTGDNVVEVFCHGNLLLLDLAVELFIKHGARMALPGEFTQRAFLNGKIDLTQAESIQELISAESEQQIKTATEMLSGVFAVKIRQLREKLIRVIGWSEASIDFSEEEDATQHQRTDLLKRLDEVINEIQLLIESYKEGKLIRNGIRVAIAGETNAGKSSLMNALFDKEKSIVTPIHGTTRDVVEGSLTMCGMKVIFNDTAGIRKASDMIEAEGIRRTHEAIAEADIVLYVLDASKNGIIHDKKIWDDLSHKESIFVINKTDIHSPAQIKWLEEVPSNRCFISAKKKEGIDKVKSFIIDKIMLHLDNKERVGYAVNQRHFISLKAGLASLQQGRQAVLNNESEECFVIYFKEATEALCEILGEVTSDDVLNKIFSEFCIGK